jgi:hypothetical protein
VYAAVYCARQRLKFYLLINEVELAETERFELSVPL